MVQSRSIVCSVTGYGNYGPFLLEQLNQSLLVHRAGTTHNFQVEYTFKCLFIAQCSKFHTGDPVTFRIFRLPQADLTGNFRGCTRSISRYNFYADAGRLAFLDSIRDIRPDRVADGKNAQECQTAFIDQFRAIFGCSFRDILVSQSQSTHRFVLVSKQLFVERGYFLTA